MNRLDDVIASTNEAIEAAKKHASLARGVLATGAKLLKEASDKKDLEIFVKATAALEKGARMERDANDTITHLQKTRPRPKG